VFVAMLEAWVKMNAGSAHLGNVRKKLTDLVKLESILAETVAHCSDGATPDCPVLDILDAGRTT
jgi:MerR family transcriptional regulator, mercuric resistance operon regulatory protein